MIQKHSEGGITLPCPRCGESEAEIELRLWSKDYHCTQCNADITHDEMRGMLAAWSKIIAWVDTMPCE